MHPRILTRVVTFDPETKQILLVRNKDADFWYPPGGGWEFDQENIVECCVREVHEETGLKIEVRRFLYLKEFHSDDGRIFFETVWLATPVGVSALNYDHVDLDPQGAVEEGRWFTQAELEKVTVFPDRLQHDFWNNLDHYFDSEDPFLGVAERTD